MRLKLFKRVSAVLLTLVLLGGLMPATAFAADPVENTAPAVEDFALANLGRQLWSLQGNSDRWMVVARNNRDNDRLRAAAKENDLLAGLCDFPGPIALLRDGETWENEELSNAAAQFVSYAPRAMQANEQAPNVPVRVWLKNAATGQQQIVSVLPDRERTLFARPSWEEVKAQKHELASRMDALHKEKLAAEKKARQLAWEREHGQTEHADSDAQQPETN